MAADRYLIETSGTDGYQLEDGSGVLLIENPYPPTLGNEGNYQPNPLPRQSATIVALTIGLCLLQSTLAPAQPPFHQDNWPNPRTSAGLMVTIETLPPEPQAPFGQEDWPNPLAEPYPISLRTHTDSFKLTLNGKDQFYGAPGQGPVYSYPNPQPLRAFSHLSHWTGSGLNETVLGAVAPPFAQDDWPLPAVLRPALIALRTHTDPVKLVLLGKDQFFYAPGQGPAYDYPNPQGKGFPVDLRTWTLATPTALKSGTPFIPVLFPNPVLARTTPPTWTANVQLTLLGQDTFFVGAGRGPVYDWPNPRAIASASDLRSISIQNLLESTLGVVVTPFNQDDWPVPAGRGYPVSLRTWLEQRKQYYVDLSPNNQYSWPNPLAVPAQSQLRNWTQGLFTASLFGTTPFTQSDWPNPVGRGYPVSLRTWLEGRKFYYVDLVPRNQYDWPNPRPVPALSNLRHELRNLLESTLIPVPFAQLYWPNPLPIPSQAQLRQWSQERKTYYGDTVNLTLSTFLDWPVPQGKPYPHVLRTWVLELLQSTLAPTVFFFPDDMIVATVDLSQIAHSVDAAAPGYTLDLDTLVHTTDGTDPGHCIEIAGDTRDVEFEE